MFRKTRFFSLLYLYLYTRVYYLSPFKKLEKEHEIASNKKGSRGINKQK